MPLVLRVIGRNTLQQQGDFRAKCESDVDDFVQRPMEILLQNHFSVLPLIIWYFSWFCYETWTTFFRYIPLQMNRICYKLHISYISSKGWMKLVNKRQKTEVLPGLLLTQILSGWKYWAAQLRTVRNIIARDFMTTKMTQKLSKTCQVNSCRLTL